MSKSEIEIIGESPQIKGVIAIAQKIAKSASITTLIIGESGTGKDLVARLIHNIGSAENQPFVDINCGAIPESLLESELFGYEKGAFTGAHTRKPGLFELAHGGTIFLDEISNTTPGLQAKLLKAVEHKRFRRINGVEEVQVSTRIIAASNTNLKAAVKAGRFREDLYYRLNVSHIYVPPLRERNHDALILAEHFIALFNREYARDIKGLSPSATKFIKNYRWPGNVRQLRNAIERAVLVEAEDWIEVEHLALDSKWENEKSADGLSGNHEKVIHIASNELKSTRFDIPADGISLEEIERNIILSALERADGNISKAARLLKINRGKLRYRMERIGVSNRTVYEIKARAIS